MINPPTPYQPDVTQLVHIPISIGGSATAYAISSSAMPWPFEILAIAWCVSPQTASGNQAMSRVNIRLTDEATANAGNHGSADELPGLWQTRGDRMILKDTGQLLPLKMPVGARGKRIIIEAVNPIGLANFTSIFIHVRPTLRECPDDNETPSPATTDNAPGANPFLTWCRKVRQ